MPPVARIAHACPSRTRLQFSDLKGERDALTALADALAALSGVEQVDARPATGSVIISHSGTTKDLIAAAGVSGLFVIEEIEETFTPSFEAAAWKARADTFVKDTLGSGFDVRSVTALAFIAMALRQLAAGNVMPPAATALWYGLSILLGGNAPPDAGANGGDGGGGE